MDELVFASAEELADAIRTKRVSSVEVLTAHLQRIEDVNPKLNAIVQLRSQEAIDEARQADAALARGEDTGPLHGVPISIKDSLDTAGVITAAGTKGRANHVPREDATVVARLRAAGAILLGKSNSPELNMSSQTDNLVYGRTNNPYDLTRSPGGSSGGEAAIIAAGGSPLGIGTDMFGSIRLPCHVCGIAGIKPTSGRVPRTGDILAFSTGTFDSWGQVGPMARFVKDLALVLPLISGCDWKDPGIVPVPLHDPGAVQLEDLRVAFYTDNGTTAPAPEIAAAVSAAVDSLRGAVAHVREDQPEDVPQPRRASDGWDWLRRALDRVGTTEVTPKLEREHLARSNASTSAELTSMLDELQLFRSAMLQFMKAYDVIICPVNPLPAIPHDDNWSYGSGMSYTMTYNRTGWPAAVVRAGTSPEGLPLGVQVVARPWREDVALAVASHIEAALGGWQRPEF